MSSHLSQLESQLEVANARHAAAEARWMGQYSSLAQNNTSLARANNRLSQELDRTKSESDRLRHALTAHSAMLKSKISEQEAQVQALVEENAATLVLLNDANAANDALHAQLFAKQEVITYLEWRLARLQPILEKHGISHHDQDNMPGATAPSPVWEESNVPTVSPPHPATADSFEVHEDDDGEENSAPFPQQQKQHLDDAFSTNSELSSNESLKENVLRPLHLHSSTPLVDGSPSKGTIIETAADPRPLSRCGSGKDSEGSKESNSEEDDDLHEEMFSISITTRAKHRQSHSHVTSRNSQSSRSSRGCRAKRQQQQQQQQQQQLQQAEDDPITPTDQIVANTHTPSLRTKEYSPAPSTATKAVDVPRTAPRTSSRVRPKVSYALPSVNSKLRQGMPFTFGDANALGASTATAAKSRSQSVSKPPASSHRSSKLNTRGSGLKPTLESLEEN